MIKIIMITIIKIVLRASANKVSDHGSPKNTVACITVAIQRSWEGTLVAW
jgi:hypothetical protein